MKPDYSDLEAVVKDLLGDPDRMQRIADTAFQRLLSHASVRALLRRAAASAARPNLVGGVLRCWAVH